jgi:hypothetical protein
MQRLGMREWWIGILRGVEQDLLSHGATSLHPVPDRCFGSFCLFVACLDPSVSFLCAFLCDLFLSF